MNLYSKTKTKRQIEKWNKYSVKTCHSTLKMLPTNILTLRAFGITSRIFSFYLAQTHTCTMAYHIYNGCMIAEEMYANECIHITVFKIKVILWFWSGFGKSSYIFHSLRLMFLVKSYSFILWWPPFPPSSYLVPMILLQVHFLSFLVPCKEHQGSICSSLNLPLPFPLPWFFFSSLILHRVLFAYNVFSGC